MNYLFHKIQARRKNFSTHLLTTSRTPHVCADRSFHLVPFSSTWRISFSNFCNAVLWATHFLSSVCPKHCMLTLVWKDTFTSDRQFFFQHLKGTIQVSLRSYKLPQVGGTLISVSCSIMSSFSRADLGVFLFSCVLVIVVVLCVFILLGV